MQEKHNTIIKKLIKLITLMLYLVSPSLWPEVQIKNPKFVSLGALFSPSGVASTGDIHPRNHRNLQCLFKSSRMVEALTG
jgi:hypothetical protein